MKTKREKSGEWEEKMSFNGAFADEGVPMGTNVEKKEKPKRTGNNTYVSADKDGHKNLSGTNIINKEKEKFIRAGDNVCITSEGDGYSNDSDTEKQKLKDALLKRALGYMSTEQNDEYSLVDGSLALIKRRISLKEVPPELRAIEILLSEPRDDFSSLSEEELEKEKIRLIKLLKQF